MILIDSRKNWFKPVLFRKINLNVPRNDPILIDFRKNQFCPRKSIFAEHKTDYNRFFWKNPKKSIKKWLFPLFFYMGIVFMDERDDQVSSILSFFNGFDLFLDVFMLMDQWNDQVSWILSCFKEFPCFLVCFSSSLSETIRWVHPYLFLNIFVVFSVFFSSSMNETIMSVPCYLFFEGFLVFLGVLLFTNGWDHQVSSMLSFLWRFLHF